MRHGDNSRALVEQVLVFIDNELAAFIYRDDANAGPPLGGNHLPRDYVRVVLHLAHKDLVALADKLAAIRVGYQVNPLGRAANKNALFGLAGIYKALYFFAGRLVSGGRVLRQVMHAA